MSGREGGRERGGSSGAAKPFLLPRSLALPLLGFQAGGLLDREASVPLPAKKLFASRAQDESDNAPRDMFRRENPDYW